MPTSGNTAWIQTAGQLCASAAYELGALPMGDSLEASEEAEMVTRLNGMLAKWSKEMNMWREGVATVTITGGTGAATLPGDVLDVRGARFVQSATYKRMLAPWNRDQFFALPNRAQAGAPIAYYYSQQIDGDQLFLWPVPADDAQIELDYNRAFYFVEGPEQTLDIPREWYEAALYGLAARSANIFGSARLDPAGVARVDAQSRQTYQEMLDSDRPDSYQFEWDSPVEANP